MAQKPCGRRNRRIPEGISQTCADSRPDSPARKLRLRQQNFQFLNGDERAAEALRELIHKARLGIGRGRNQGKPEFVHRGREKVLRFRSARKAHSRPQNRARKRSVLRRIVFWGNRAPQIPRRARFFSKNMLKFRKPAPLWKAKFSIKEYNAQRNSYNRMHRSAQGRQVALALHDVAQFPQDAGKS